MNAFLDADAARAVCGLGLDLCDLLCEVPERVARPLIDSALEAYRRALVTRDEAAWGALFRAVKAAVDAIDTPPRTRSYARLCGFLGENADLQTSVQFV